MFIPGDVKNMLVEELTAVIKPYGCPFESNIYSKLSNCFLASTVLTVIVVCPTASVPLISTCVAVDSSMLEFTGVLFASTSAEANRLPPR